MSSKQSKKKKKITPNVERADHRFDAIRSDPRFDSLPKREQKVVVDERFKAMFNSKFTPKCNIDMRGRRLNFGKKNKLDSLYELSDDAQSDDSDQIEITLDLARGKGNLPSSDEDSSSEWELEKEEEAHDWGEMDKDAKRVEWASRRLALCNMEWDRINANDLFVLISSFKPPAPAAIQSVTIYKSEFGQRRLEEEEQSGPKLSNLKRPIKDGDDDEQVREAIRSYELERMRYFYAIIECDSVQTASAVYEACDGVEFESSAITLDLRFVPDSMEFEESLLRERVVDEVDINTFQPKFFESVGRSKSCVKLTWDETNPDRIKAERDAFLPDADLSNLQYLIAPCSSDEENVDDSKVAAITGEVDSQSTLGKDENCMEVTWGAEDTIDKVEVKRKNDEQTPWEKYLEKRKKKRKERKAMIAELKKASRDQRSEESEVKVARKAVKVEKKNDIVESDSVEDQRFAALYENSAYAIDQSHPLFKSNTLVMKQVSEKQKRKLQSEQSVDQTTDFIAEKLKRKAMSGKFLGGDKKTKHSIVKKS